MSISMYEAVALYDYEQCKQTLGEGAITTLVFHMDRCGIGVCACSEKGVKLLGQNTAIDNQSLYDELISRLAMALGEVDTAAVETQWNTQVEGMNPIVKRYLRSGRMMDNEALKSYTKEIALKVSELEKQFEDITAKWNGALEEGSRLLQGLGISEDDIRILVVGNLAKSYFAEYAVKAYFCAMPFLADLRFADYIQREDTSRIVQLGEEIHTARSVVGHEIALIYWESGVDGAGAEKVQLLASPRQALLELEQATYWEGMLVEKEEGVTLRIDKQIVKIELPYMLAADAVDKVDVALKAVENKLMLSLRRTEMPAKVYDIPLEKYGVGKEQA